MHLADIAYLQSPEAAAWLDRLVTNPVSDTTHLSVATQLGHEVGPERARLLIETSQLRQKAGGKFRRAAEMLFTRDGLEQATAETVAQYRAERFSAAGLDSVVELGSGIGGDSLALAHDAEVIGIDYEPALLAIARHNVAVYGNGGKFTPVTADLATLPPFEASGFFFDPARRTERSTTGRPSRRFFSVQDYRPPLSLIDRWRRTVPHGCVKVSPGIDYAEIPQDARPEFISLKGEVKECSLWYGNLTGGSVRRATLFPGGHTLSIETEQEPDIVAGQPRRFLYEPDGAVIRAHLVRTLAQKLSATLIDESIAYLTADTNQPSPFATAYEVEAAFPFQLKRLRHYCRENDIGEVVVKKRGSPLDPEDLRRALRLSGSRSRVLFLTRVADAPTVIVAVGPFRS